jgi:hypothetical protein
MTIRTGAGSGSRRGVLFAVAWSAMLGGIMLTGMTAEQPMMHSAHFVAVTEEHL